MWRATLAVNRDEWGVLEALLWQGGGSRLELAGSLNYSKSRLTAIVAALIDAELIEETGDLHSSGGRRAAGLQLSCRSGLTVAIDLGASGVDVALRRSDTGVIGRRSALTDGRAGPGAVLAVVIPLIDALLAEAGQRREAVGSIGMGVPGPVEVASGLLISPPLMPDWEGFSLREYFAELFAAPVVIDNDVNLMALGELHHARQRQFSRHEPNRREPTRHDENFIVVKLGTGIGAGVIARGQVFRGADGAAGDIGHICVDPNGTRCSCGNVGCLEALSGGPGIVREALEAAQDRRSPLLAEMLGRAGVLSVQGVGQAARQGDEAANRIIHQAGQRIGQVLAGLVNFMNPSHLLIGGGVSHVGPLLLASIRQRVYASSLPLSTRKLQIEHTRLGDGAGLRGAAVLAALHRLSVGGPV